MMKYKKAPNFLSSFSNQSLGSRDNDDAHRIGWNDLDMMYIYSV